MAEDDSLGDAWVDVHARVDDKKFGDELERGVKAAGKDAEGDFDKVGKDLGDVLGEAVSKQSGKHGKDIVAEIEKSVSKQDADFTPNWRYNRRGKNGRFIAKAAGEMVDQVQEAFTAASGAGGVFSKIGTAISDAIGAGFNISGKSPLIAILIPAMAALVGLVIGALQAANALVAVIATLPAVLFAVGLQAGVLFLAFQGIGTAVQGAFSAKNANELKEALKDLEPAAQKFVKSLLPLEGLFDKLQKTAQQSFFKPLADLVPKIQASLGPNLVSQVDQLAGALGRFANTLGLVFASPAVKQFIAELVPATVKFLDTFGPAMASFLVGLTELSTVLLPFLNDVNSLLSGTLFQLGIFFENAAKDPETKKWLDDMYITLVQVVSLLGQVIEFFAVLFAQINAAGGSKLLDEISIAVERLTFVLGSPVGLKAIEGLIHVSIIGIQVLTGLLIILLGIFAAIEVIAEWIKNTGIPALERFWQLLTVALPKSMADWVRSLPGLFVDFIVWIRDMWNWVWDFITRQIPRMLLQGVVNWRGLLYNAGSNLVLGLVDGIASRVAYLRQWAAYLASIISSFLPGSPAEEGPLSGSGYTRLRGQRMVQDFAKGMEETGPKLRSAASDMASSIVFGANSIQVGFNGAVPTRQEAFSTGQAVATGIMGLAARDTRLAVRTL